MAEDLYPSRRQHVIFKVGEQQIELYEKDGVLFVYADRTLNITPKASNAFTLTVESQ